MSFGCLGSWCPAQAPPTLPCAGFFFPIPSPTAGDQPCVWGGDSEATAEEKRKRRLEGEGPGQVPSFVADSASRLGDFGPVTEPSGPLFPLLEDGTNSTVEDFLGSSTMA